MKNKTIHRDTGIVRTKQEAIDRINKMSDDGFFYLLTLEHPEQFKSNSQNKTFHLLLNEFYNSGQSSFDEFDKLRTHYKNIGGLVKKLKIFFTEITKKWMWKGLKDGILQGEIDDDEKIKIIDFFNGEILQEKSWADISKKNATFVIDTLIKDMIEAGVNSPEFNKIIEQFEKDKELYIEALKDEDFKNIINNKLKN